MTDVEEQPVSGSCIFEDETPTSFIPAQGDGADATDYELGTKFTVADPGFILQLQYFRDAVDATDTDTRTLTLWDQATGLALGSVQVISAPEMTGWQIGTLATAIAVEAGRTYVVSYGYDQDAFGDAYAADSHFFAAASNSSNSGSVTAPQSGATTADTVIGGGLGNGLFSTTVGSMPDSSFNSTNYWVDVVFQTEPGPPNTPPQITSASSFDAAENQVLVGTVTATDAESDALTYGIASGGDGALFRIDPTTGLLQFAAVQDFETAPASYALTVTVSDGTETVLRDITVTLSDLDETVRGAAAFTGASLTANYVFGTDIAALYPGAGATQSAVVGAGIEFQSLPEAGQDLGNGPFGLASVDVEAQTIRIEFPVDGSLGSFHAFSPLADTPFDGVQLLDTTDSLPTILSVRIIGQEGFTDQAGALVNLTDSDLTVTGDGLFLNLAGKGRMTDVDLDQAGLQHSYVTLLVDLNDAPVMTSNGGAASVALDVAENSTLVTILDATDADTGQVLSYALSGEDAALFEIRGNELHFRTAPDAEDLPDAGTTPGYQVTVEAGDGFGGIDSQAIAVTVTDVNEFGVSTPVSQSPGPPFVTENAVGGTLVGITAAAFDLDATDNAVRYSLTSDAGGRFVIDATTGVVSVAEGASFDSGIDGAALGITVQAESADGSVASTGFTIALAPVGAPIPAPQDIDAAANAVMENASTGTLVGITAHATDPDPGDMVTYSLANNAGGRFAINAVTGAVSVAGPINRETDGPTLGITVLATSQDGSSASADFAIAVGDVDEFNTSPIVDSNPRGNWVYENAAVGTLVGVTASALDGDATQNAITYSLTKNAGGRFAIDATTGVISVGAGAAIDYEAAKLHSVTVKATSADGSSTTKSIKIDILNVDESVSVDKLFTGSMAGDDLSGGVGNDTINGMSGNDTLAGLDGNDYIDGGTGHDLILGGAGNDTLTGGLSIEVAGALGIDTVYGGDGDDVILIKNCYAEVDVMFGGNGNDTILVTSDAKYGHLRYLQTPDIETFDGNGKVVRGYDTPTLLDFSTFTSVINVVAIWGDGGADLIIGSRGADSILGGTQDDTLKGGAGNDTLDGGRETDVVSGDADDDTILIRGIEAQTDWIDGGDGIDTIRVDKAGAVTLNGTERISSVEVFDGFGQIIQGTKAAETFDFRSFASVIEVAAVRAGSGNDALFGSAAADVFDGVAGNDTLDGGYGSDRLTGGTGNDTFRFVFGAQSGTDTITDFDGSGNDVIRLAGFAGVTAQDVRDATVFDSAGASIDLTAIGGEGSILLAGVRSLTFGAEDFVFV